MQREGQIRRRKEKRRKSRKNRKMAEKRRIGIKQNRMRQNGANGGNGRINWWRGKTTPIWASFPLLLLFLSFHSSNGQHYELFPTMLQQQLNSPLNGGRQQTQNGGPSESVSIRLIDEILEIFVPPEKFTSRGNQQGRMAQEMPIPYGLNRLMARTPRSRDLVVERETTGQQAMERRFSPAMLMASNDAAERGQAPWANLAREVLNVFQAIQSTTPTTTTTTTTTQMSLLEKIMPKFLSPFGFGTTPPPPTVPPPLFPFFTKSTPLPSPSFFSFFRQEQSKREESAPNPLVEPVAKLFGVEKKAVEEGRAHIDTGGNSFDRFVVREKVDADNPFAAIIGGNKWNERGIKWEDGNIRLVNKNGNSFLGSEVGVNDRSVDIPLKRWLDIANGFVNYNQVQQDRVGRWR